MAEPTEKQRKNGEAGEEYDDYMGDLSKSSLKKASYLGKDDAGRAEPVGLEIRRSRSGIGGENPYKEKRKREDIDTERKRRKEDALMEEFGSRQKSQLGIRRVIVNFSEAKAALDQMEHKEVVLEKEDDEDGEQEEEEICSSEILSF